MCVAECGIVFRFGRALAPRTEPWSVDELLAAVDGVGPGIEVPESRFRTFERAGESQLIADRACENEPPARA